MGTGSAATVVIGFHRTGTAEDFAAYAQRLGQSAVEAPGCLGWSVSVLASDHLGWAIAVRFADEAALHRWLDASQLWAAVEGTPQSACLDLVVGESPRTPGVALVHHDVEPAKESAFVAALERLTELAERQPGYAGTIVFAPSPSNARWVSVIRFRTDQQLHDWMGSTSRRDALPELRGQLESDFRVVTHTAFGSTVRVVDGVAAATPNWKTNLTVLLVLYPTVMLLARFVDPLIRRLGTDVWLTMFLSQVISVSLLTWVLMPAAGVVLRRWLDPVTGAGWRESTAGALVVAAGYAVFLTVFGTVEHLQFWTQ